MFNKRELVLIISLAFCFGVIFSDFTKPKAIQADTSNYVIGIVDSKISVVTKKLNALAKRVSDIESNMNKKDAKVKDLSNVVKQLSSVQKDLSNSLDKVARDLLVLKNAQNRQ